MNDASDEEYTTPLDPDMFAAIFGYPPALVHLAIDCGLKAPAGKITGLAFCRWFTSHYNELRARAGLPLLDAPAKSMPAGERRQLTICNVLRTLADYSASRTSSIEYRDEWNRLSEEVRAVCFPALARPVVG